jgi:hypothetical protein
LIHASFCKILQNWQAYGLQLSTTPPHCPGSGSLFLFHKSVKFRKDGIPWKKQKDGKTVAQSHEKLKVGGVRVISCAYTTSEECETFHRRTYSLVDGDSSIALVHYLDEAVAQKFSSSDVNPPAYSTLLTPRFEIIRY